MFKFIEFLRKRPKDKTIRLMRVIFWLIILALLWIYFKEYKLSLPDSLKQYELQIKYALFILWLVPVIMWAIDPCFAKRKVVKLIQITFWIVLIVVWNMIYFEDIKTEVAATAPTKNWSIDVSSLDSKAKKTNLNIWLIIALLWILPLLWWVTWKCITQKCFKHWEIITKIRV